ncbi:hypothetical protein AWM75_02955 [Aerococcus urinaehominis]|uniref:Uncharacterized protein n=1 Tax=Aerococcus urinaehominis TaxID=128944 RepID=A0A0X8FL11_9LACT|nr:Rib/alpha-like domain-containing protein [Aerococcus urinaehominis]AMB99019.1 hypothetical protein AWM75_02955 [Aerococcus urinaehominis]SDM56458.1 signal peptide-containing protein, YSIRK family [Aerococcus urinaehominis]
MVGKNNHQLRQEKMGQKVFKYSIRRLSVGVASVAVAAGILFASQEQVAQAASTEASVSETTAEAVETEPAGEAMTQPEPETTINPATEANEVPVESVGQPVEGSFSEKVGENTDSTIEEDAQPDANRVMLYAAPTNNTDLETGTRAADNPAANEAQTAELEQEIPFREETFGEKTYDQGEAGPIRFNTAEVRPVDSSSGKIDLALRFWPQGGAASRWGTVEGTKYPGRYVIGFANPEFYKNIASIETTDGNGPLGTTVWSSNESGRDWTMPLTNANLKAGIEGSLSPVDVRITLKEGVTLDSLGLANTPLPFTVGMVTGSGAGNEFNLVESRSIDNSFILANNPNNPDPAKNPELFAPNRTSGAAGESRFADGLFTTNGIGQSVYYDQDSNSIISRHTINYPPQNMLQSNYNWALYVKEQIPKVLVQYVDPNGVKLGVMNDTSNPNLFRNSLNEPIDPIPLVMDDTGLVDSSRTPAISITQADPNNRQEQIAALKNAQKNLDSKVFEGTIGQPRTYSIVYPLVEGASITDIANALAEYTKQNKNKLLFESWLEADFVDTPGGPLNGQIPYADNGAAPKRLVNSYANAYFDSYYELSQASTNEPTTQQVTTEVGTVPEADAGITNKAELPEGTTFAWETAPDVSKVTTKDDQGNDVPVTGRVRVTYPDTSSEVVTVPVVVTEKTAKEADSYNPVANPVTKDQGQAVTEDEVKKSVTVPNYTENPKYPGQTPTVSVDNPSQLPDGSTVGTTNVPVTVTYPDGSTDKLNVPVTINPAKPEAKTNVIGTVKPVEPTAAKQDTGLVVENPSTDTTVAAKDEDGKDIPTEIGQDGKISVTPGTDVDGPIKVTVTDPDLANGEESFDVPVNGHTQGQDDNQSATSVDDSQVTPVDPADKKQGTGIVVKNPDKDTKVSGKDEDGKDIPTVINPDTGEVEVTPGTNVDGPITVTVEDPELPAGKQEIEVPVNNHTNGVDDNNNGNPTSPKTNVTGTVKSVEPTADQQDTGLVVENPSADTTISAKDEDDKDIPVEIGQDGKVLVTPGTDVDGPIKVTVTDPDLTNGAETYDVPVTGHTAGKDDNGNGQPTGPVTPEAKTNVTGIVTPVNPTADQQDTGLVVENPSADTTVSAKDEDGKDIPVEIGQDGKVLVTPGTDVDGPIKVTVTDPDLTNGAETYDVPVNGHTVDKDDNGNGQPIGPVIPEAKTNVTGTVTPVNPTADQQDTGLVVENPSADTTVSAKDEDGKDIPVEIGQDGKISVTPGTDVDGPIKVTVTDPDLTNGAETYDVPVNGHTVGKDDNGNGQPTGPVTPEVKTNVTGTVKPVNPTADKQDTGLVVENPSADTTVSAKDEDGKDIPVEIGQDGKISVTPGTDVDGPIKVTVKDPDLANGEESFEVPVNGHKDDQDDNGTNTSVDDSQVKPVKPTDDKQGTGIIVKNPDADTKVSAKDEDGKDIPVVINPETGEVEVTPGTKVDGPITVIVEDPQLPGGKQETEVPVDGHAKDQNDNPTSVDNSNIKSVNPTKDKQGTGIIVNHPDKDTKVSAKDEDGKDVPVVINPETGEVEVTPGTNVDGPITVVVTDPELPNGYARVEVPVNNHEKDKDDNGDGKPTGPVTPEAKTTVDESKVTPVNPTDDKQGTGIIVNNPDKDTKVTAKDEDGKDIPAVINPATGEVEVTPGTKVDGPITVVVTDKDLPGGQTTITVPVVGHEAGRDDNKSGQPGKQDPVKPGTETPTTKTTVDESKVTPVNPTDDKQGTGIIVNNPDKDTKVTAKDEDGNTVPAVINPATGEVEVTPGTKVDGPITVVVTDKDLPGGQTTITVPVVGHETGRDDNKSGQPGKQDPIKPGTETPTTKTTVDESKVTPVQPTDDKQGTGIIVNNPDKDTTVTAKDEDGNPVPAVINPATGEVEVTPGTKVDGPITVVVTDKDLPGGQATITVPVVGHEAGRDDNKSGQPGKQDPTTPTTKTTVDESKVTPVQPTDDKQGTGIIVNNPDKDTTVTAKDEDGNSIPAVINPATGEVEVTPGTKVDGPITVVVTDKDLPGGQATITIPVVGHEAGRDDNKSGQPDAQDPAQPSDKGQTKPTDQAGIADPVKPAAKASQPAKAATSIDSAVKEQLPSTGAVSMSYLALTLAGLGSVFALAGRRKKED